MKRFKKFLATAMALLMLPALGLTAFAATGDTADDPFDGGHDYNSSDADAGTIILHKLDMSAFERKIKADLVKAGTITESDKVTYHPDENPTGLPLGDGDQIGIYKINDQDPGVRVNKGDMPALGNITFHIEQVMGNCETQNTA